MNNHQHDDDELLPLQMDAFLYQFQERPRSEFAQRLHLNLSEQAKRESRRGHKTHFTNVGHLFARLDMRRRSAAPLIALLIGAMLAILLLSNGTFNRNLPRAISGALDSQATPTLSTPAAQAIVNSSVEQPLGVVPSNCPVSPEPMAVAPQFDKAVGGYPIWGVGFQGPTAQLVFASDSKEVGHDPTFGWSHDITWLVRRSYSSGKVTFDGHNLMNNSLLAFSIGSHEPRTEIVLQPALSDALDANWVLYHSTIYVSAAGCYELHATWDGGNWTIYFAAGRNDDRLIANAAQTGSASAMPTQVKVAVSIPEDAITNHVWSMQVGDVFNIQGTFLFVNLNQPSLTVIPGTVPTFSLFTELPMTPNSAPTSIAQSADTTGSRTITQTFISNAQIISIESASYLQDTKSQMPLVVLVSVDPKDANALKWAIDNKIPLTFITSQK